MASNEYPVLKLEDLPEPVRIIEHSPAVRSTLDLLRDIGERVEYKTREIQRQSFLNSQDIYLD